MTDESSDLNTSSDEDEGINRTKKDKIKLETHKEGKTKELIDYLAKLQTIFKEQKEIKNRQKEIPNEIKDFDLTKQKEFQHLKDFLGILSNEKILENESMNLFVNSIDSDLIYWIQKINEYQEFLEEKKDKKKDEKTKAEQKKLRQIKKDIEKLKKYSASYKKSTHPFIQLEQANSLMDEVRKFKELNDMFSKQSESCFENLFGFYLLKELQQIMKEKHSWSQFFYNSIQKKILALISKGKQKQEPKIKDEQKTLIRDYNMNLTKCQINKSLMKNNIKLGIENETVSLKLSKEIDKKKKQL
eukprot:Anaeramoba_ignava/c21284_g1_i1.p1 GENE.c21284_g1_i1~~c21284_g1_i1.p1  ORF type:complete len:320 (-),score=125.60 c21284_g1_i1:659-1561(-)